jgi:hypothetical protein
MEDGKKLSMGGNTGIFYGKKEIEYPTNGTKPDSKVEFFLDEVEEYSEIEGNRLPQIDDLILNIDGCFYRVMDILDEKSVSTNRITLQGTGGGGGVGPGGGSSTLILNVSSLTGGYYSSGVTSIPISVMALSSDETNYISKIECSLDAKFSDVFLTKIVQIPMETPYELDLIAQKDNFSAFGTKVYIRITDKYGITRSEYYTIRIVTL